MSRLFLFAIGALVLCSTDGFAQGAGFSTISSPETLLARSQEWVDTWNVKDVERMRRLHADDVADQRYVIGNGFGTMEELLRMVREENFWNVTWSIKIVDPKVRMLGSDGGLVSFLLVGTETTGGGVPRPFSEAFSLVFQRIRGEWLIVHVHDSSRLEPES